MSYIVRIPAIKEKKERTLRIKARCSEASVCADRCLIVVCRTALFRCSLRRTELSDSCIGVELDCSALLLAKPALVGICKEGFICRRTSLVVVGCCCKRSRCTRDIRNFLDCAQLKLRPLVLTQGSSVFDPRSWICFVYKDRSVLVIRCTVRLLCLKSSRRSILLSKDNS